MVETMSKEECVPYLRREPLLSSSIFLLCRNVDPVLPRSSNFSREAENPYCNIKYTIFKHVYGWKWLFGSQFVALDLNEQASLRKCKETKGRPILARKREAESKGRKGQERGTERKVEVKFHQPQNLAYGPQTICLLIWEQKGGDEERKKKEGKGEKEPTLEHLLDGRCCIRCFHICTFPEIWQWEKKHPMHGEKRELYQNTNHLCVRWWEPPFQFPTIFNHKYNMVILTL